MNEVKRLFMELYYEVFKISLLHAFADTIIFFLVMVNITTLVKVSYLFALGLSVVFIVVDVTYRMKKTTLKDIEAVNPQVQDILRTARDNTDETNFMVLAMFEELIQRMKSVSAGSILNHRNLMIKILVVCLLSFSVIVVSANNIHVPQSLFDPNTYYKFF